MPKKLLFSTEGYDSIFQGPRPNGSCAQWMIQEYGKPTFPHSLGEHNFFNEEGKMFTPEQLNFNAFPDNFHHKNFEYKYYHELNGENHLYLIIKFSFFLRYFLLFFHLINIVRKLLLV